MINKKMHALIFFSFFLLPLAFGSYASAQLPDVPIEISTFNPLVKQDTSLDLNKNKVHDHLENIVSNGFESEYYTTVVTFDTPLNDMIRNSIESLDGIIVSSWSVIYGAAVRIKGTEIGALAAIPGVNFVTENYMSKAMLSTSVPQINVRPYVWDTLGFEGDVSDAIAIIDTGIDDTHPDFTGRISHWEDFIGHDAYAASDEYVTETDWNGHGTHVSSIAAGSGAAAGTAASVEISSTLGLPHLDEQYGLINHVDVETTGTVSFEIWWDETDTPDNSGDTLFLAFDSNPLVAGFEDITTQDYGTGVTPLTFTSGTLSPGKYQYIIGPYEGGSPSSEIARAKVQYKITRPASSTSDGNNKYRGVAPGCEIVALKALDDLGIGTQTEFTDALDWIAVNGGTYNIAVVSMSLGFDSEIPAVDTAINNLVSLGYVCVAAAGNGHTDGDFIYSPGTASKAITVGAIDDVDKVAIYSSNGDTGSGKPDILAPGGAYKDPIGADENTHPIVAADTNDKDVIDFSSGSPTTYWEDELNTDDYIAFQGTSMATPHIAGLVALMIEAMGSDWTHTEANVLFIKNILCGTATEVRYGEVVDIYSNPPSLNRGARDLVEGFGKAHGDAAIEAFLSTYSAGTNVTESLSNSPTGMQSWARKVELVELIEFTAGIEMDGSADFDLYLYDPSVDVTSASAILASSTTATVGVPENILYTPANNKTVYLVVKRVSGSGSFTLSAEATKTGTPSNSFTFPFGIPFAAWIVLSTIGLASVILIAKKRK